MSTEGEKLLLAAVQMQITLEALDSIRETSLYRQAIKKKISSLEKDIEQNLTRDFYDIYMEDQENCNELMRQVENIAEWIVNAPLNDVLELGRGLKNGNYRFEE